MFLYSKKLASSKTRFLLGFSVSGILARACDGAVGTCRRTRWSIQRERLTDMERCSSDPLLNPDWMNGAAEAEAVKTAEEDLERSYKNKPVKDPATRNSPDDETSMTYRGPTAAMSSSTSYGRVIFAS